MTVIGVGVTIFSAGLGGPAFWITKVASKMGKAKFKAWAKKKIAKLKQVTAKSPEKPAQEARSNTKETMTRKQSGRDGGRSDQIIERDSDGNVISRTHRVRREGEVLHQHQNQVGKYGGERQFPDEWTGTETINAPYENVPPQFGWRE